MWSFGLSQPPWAQQPSQGHGQTTAAGLGTPPPSSLGGVMPGGQGSTSGPTVPRGEDYPQAGPSEVKREGSVPSSASAHPLHGYSTFPYPSPGGPLGQENSGNAPGSSGPYSAPLPLDHFPPVQSAPRPWIPLSSTSTPAASSSSHHPSNMSIPVHSSYDGSSLYPNINQIPPPAESPQHSPFTYPFPLDAGPSSSSSSRYGPSSQMASGLARWTSTLEGADAKGKRREGTDEWMNEELGREFKRRMLGEVVGVDVQRESAQLSTLLNELVNLLQPFLPTANAPAPSPPPPYLHTRFTRLAMLVLSTLENLAPHVRPDLSPLFTRIFQAGYAGGSDKYGRGPSPKKRFEDMTPAEKEMEVIKKRRDALIAKAAAAAAAAAAATASGPAGHGSIATTHGPLESRADGQAAGSVSRTNSPSVQQRQSPGGPMSRGHNPYPAPPHLHQPFGPHGHAPQPSPSYQAYFDHLGAQHSHSHHQQSPLGNLAALTEASDLVSHQPSSVQQDGFGRVTSEPIGGYDIMSSMSILGESSGSLAMGLGGPPGHGSMLGDGDGNANGDGNTSANANGHGNGNGNGPSVNLMGRCHGCGSSVTSEWMMGPDGPGSLCDSCGMHYAKLSAKKETPTPIGLTFDHLGYFLGGGLGAGLTDGAGATGADPSDGADGLGVE
ncbi:hypothetical protein IAU60_001959 [Kwoniella sp. DSM 27419]